MNSEQLASWLAECLPRVSGLNLSPEGTQVSHVLNWGGFVNHSFTIQDGGTRYHLKLTADPDSLRRLERWRGVHELLEERYRAPRLIRWMEFPEIGFAGLLFDHLQGRTANFNTDRGLLQQLINLAGRLHRDREIHSYLSNIEPAKTCLDHFVETYIERFAGDLEIVTTHDLPFVSGRLLEWMQRETELIRETANHVPSFQQQAMEPVHGDLNEANVLLASGNWFVVDWDDLTLGDSAMELAVLLWPIAWQGGNWQDFFTAKTGKNFSQRIELCLRAQLLDEVIDPLADYVEAQAVPPRLEAVQFAKRKRHEEGLERYIGRYRGKKA